MYCTYLTIYKGNKMPMFYVGSTSIAKIKKGYRGSVSSKKYKTIWKQELKENPHLFLTKIVSIHLSRKEAIQKENFFHLRLNAASSPLYLNLANAIPNGYFGIDVTGRNNPMFGTKREDARQRMLINNPMVDSIIALKVTRTKRKLRLLGLHRSTRNKEDTLKRSSERMKLENPASIQCCCIVCKKQVNTSALVRFHKHKERNEKSSCI